MDPRYCTEEMSAIWSYQNKFETWVKVEVAVLRARVQLGQITVDVPSDLVSRIKVDPAEIDRIEKSGVGHDVMAFLNHTSPQLPKELRPWWHHKLTSYDVQDTSLMLLLQESVKVLRIELFRVMEALKKLANEHKYAGMIGRTHLVHAEPITFGVKIANWYAECRRNMERLDQTLTEVSVGKISGAVGMYTLPPEVEEQVCTTLGLRPITSTQIISRDIIARYVQTLTLVGCAVEEIALNIRLMQATEVREVQEFFDRTKQSGSSAMPHKQNPKDSENVTGLGGRVLRGYQVMATENVATMHERTLDNSGPERIFLPDSSQVAHFILRRLARIVTKLEVFPERMRRNLDLCKGLIFSQEVQALVAEQSGLPRQEAHGLVRKIALACWDDGSDFREALLADPVITAHLNPLLLERAFSLDEKLKYVDHIFKRVFGLDA